MGSALSVTSNPFLSFSDVSSSRCELEKLEMALRLRKAALSQLLDHDPLSQNSEGVLNDLEVFSELERRCLDLVTDIRADTVRKLALKLAHWMVLKDLDREDAEPEDHADALVLSCFDDLLDLAKDPVLDAMIGRH